MKTNLSKTPTNLKSVQNLMIMKKLDSYYEGEYQSGELIRISFLTDEILRIQIDPEGKFEDYPTPIDKKHQAHLTVKLPSTSTKTFRQSNLLNTNENFRIRFGQYTLVLKKNPALIEIYDEYKRRHILKEASPIQFTKNQSIQTLAQEKNEFYFGGGMQNGRFSHKGTAIEIANTNIWTDGGVSSPAPFFWSNTGFGSVRNTFKPGQYDFGKQDKNKTIISHNDLTFDSFYFVGTSPAKILENYYKLTGFPVLLPKFAFYEGHLNAYNRDYWVETDKDNPNAIKFEDEKYYEEFLPKDLANQTGILESLNGENNNYQFSARAVIDRYQKHDLPLGWFLPNDGYEAGYGQTDNFLDDLHNLESFSNYANKHGVEVGLWTQSNLHPNNPLAPQKAERDLDREITEANISALKTDVAWVGDGYSFGLNGIEDASRSFITHTKGRTRPFILTIDGWSGTQRHAAVWSGNQTGGEWEYIRFHIPTYIGASLSGLPNIGADMDGIFGGGNPEINVRDFQWKTFTPIQLNMDGWGKNPKNPFVFGRKATKINRAYLKLKSKLMPYTYSLAHEAITGKPMVRAMFVEFPHEKINYTKAVQYQYMWGPNFLIAPIYNNKVNGAGDSVRNNIYLPDAQQLWINFFTGEKYLGGASYNNLIFPHWQSPVFVKAGAIIPMTKGHNNPKEQIKDERTINFYPAGSSQFDLFDDDGTSTDYINKKATKTHIESHLNGSEFKVHIAQTNGDFNGFIKEQSTNLNILVDHHPGKITLQFDNQIFEVPEISSDIEFKQAEYGYFYNESFSPSAYFSTFSEHAQSQNAIQIKLPKLDISTTDIDLTILNVSYGSTNNFATIIDSTMHLPKNFGVNVTKSTPTSLTVHWQENQPNEQYEIMLDEIRHTNIKGTSFTFEDLDSETIYKFKIRSKINHKVSEWSEPIAGQTLESSDY